MFRRGLFRSTGLALIWALVVVPVIAGMIVVSPAATGDDSAEAAPQGFPVVNTQIRPYSN